jgi:hypothetical protein
VRRTRRQNRAKKKKAISHTACKSSTPSRYNHYTCGTPSRLPLGRRLRPCPPAPPPPARSHEFPIAGQGRGRVGGFTSANDELVAPVARAQGWDQNVCVRRLSLDHHHTLHARHTHNTHCPLKPLLVRSRQAASRDRQTRSIHAHRTKFRTRADRHRTSSPAPFSVASVGIPQSCGSATGRREGDA